MSTSAFLDDFQKLLEAFHEATDHMMWLGARLGGRQAYDAETWGRLRRSGVITEAEERQIQSGEYPGLIEDAYTTGVLLHRILEDGQDPHPWDGERWAAEIRRRPFAVSQARRVAVDLAKREAGIYCQGLANKVATRIDGELAKVVRPEPFGAVREVLTADREGVIIGDAVAREHAIVSIRDAVATGVELGEGRRRVRSRILDAINDGARDLDRIASTELQRAHDMGRAHDIGERYGRGAKVFKRPGPKACRSCRSLYVDADGQPRIFELSELETNGDNFGRKQSEWLPTVGPAHPNCHCPLYHMPAGGAFDRDGRIVKQRN